MGELTEPPDGSVILIRRKMWVGAVKRHGDGWYRPSSRKRLAWAHVQGVIGRSTYYEVHSPNEAQ